MGNNFFVSIYSQQSAICWETHATIAEAQEYLENGTAVDALFAIAIYDVAHRAIVWQEPSLDEETVAQQIENVLPF